MKKKRTPTGGGPSLGELSQSQTMIVDALGGRPNMSGLEGGFDSAEPLPGKKQALV